MRGSYKITAMISPLQTQVVNCSYLIVFLGATKWPIQNSQPTFWELLRTKIVRMQNSDISAVPFYSPIPLFDDCCERTSVRERVTAIIAFFDGECAETNVKKQQHDILP